MRKLVGVLLVAIGAVLVVAAAISLAGVVLGLLSGIALTAYVIGTIVGRLLVIVLFILLGIKAIRAGRARFTAAPASDP